LPYDNKAEAQRLRQLETPASCKTAEPRKQNDNLSPNQFACEPEIVGSGKNREK
jgi:hypothetical protein